MKFTRSEAEEIVRTNNDDMELDRDELDAIFVAIFERKPTAQDRREGVWSHCCSAFSEYGDDFDPVRDGWVGKDGMP